MRSLLPVTEETADRTGGADREWSLDELAELYAYPGPDELPKDTGLLRANMVTTLDGAAHHEGRSQGISSAADMRVFGVLRALADVVIVGAQTVRQEGYRPAKARPAFAARRAEAGQSPAPAIAVVSGSLDLDFGLPLFTEALTPTLVVTGAEAPSARVRLAEAAGAEVVVAGSGSGADPVRLRRELAARGLLRQLTEGGPQVLGQFVAAGQLDELCLTVSPTLTSGDAPRIAFGPALTGPAGSGPTGGGPSGDGPTGDRTTGDGPTGGGPTGAAPTRLTPASILTEDGFLFTRYVRA